MSQTIIAIAILVVAVAFAARKICLAIRKPPGGCGGCKACEGCPYNK